MAKDTEKLIRQLSLICYLLAERRSVTGLEIRRDVEGYSAMTEEAFSRRFYADRSELQQLGIAVTVQRPIEAIGEPETYALAPEHFQLPAIAFTDSELTALQAAVSLLDGEFAYAAPLRLALQQLSWGHATAPDGPQAHRIGLGVKASAGSPEATQRLARIETAISRRKTITLHHQTRGIEPRTVDPYHLLFRHGEFFLVGRCHHLDAVEILRLSQISGRIAYATKAEHDFPGPPPGFDAHSFANRAPWQHGPCTATAQIRVSGQIAWQIERHFARYGTVTPIDGTSDITFATEYADSQPLIGWLLGLGRHAHITAPTELEAELAERIRLLEDRHRNAVFALAAPADQDIEPQSTPTESQPPAATPVRHSSDPMIRPEPLARLVALASILVAAGRASEHLGVWELCERLQIPEEQLRHDLNVLNVVNFGGGCYVLYAEINDSGEIEVDPEPYWDTFARPARLLPVEAKALVGAIDLIGEHLPDGSLATARQKIVTALGTDPREQGLQVATTDGDDALVARVACEAITMRRLLRLEYYKPSEDEYTTREVEPYALVNGREGWYVACFDPERDDVRHFRLDRIRHAQVTDTPYRPRPGVNPATELDGWLRTGELHASRTATVWVTPERASRAHEERHVVKELADGSVIVEVPFKGTGFLVRDILAQAGDAVVLEPADARQAIHAAARRLQTRLSTGADRGAVAAAGAVS
jgi:predicted DNA-binding transcriptional regulator YafY